MTTRFWKQEQGVVDILRASTLPETAQGVRLARLAEVIDERERNPAVKILGIESSCDECSAAVVEDGRRILSNVILEPGRFPQALLRRGPRDRLAEAHRMDRARGPRGPGQRRTGMADIDAIAVTFRPGLIGSLLVGLSFAKGLAWGLGKPLVGVDHILAHLYAPHLERDIDYPYLGLLVSGGHTIIARVERLDRIEVLGTTIDDAVGEAFDKVAKHYDIGYPGRCCHRPALATGDPRAFRFPRPSLHKGEPATTCPIRG